MFSNWQKNDPRPAIFEKELTVQAVVLPRLKMKLDFEREAYGPGSEVSATLNLHTNANQPLANQALRYVVSLQGKELLTTTAQTDAAGKGKLSFDLPTDLTSNDGLLNVMIDYQGQTESISRSVPIVLNQISLAFFPEGGDMVHGLPGKVAFKALDEFGEPADVEGEIVDEDGRVVSDFRSFHQGMGAFDLNPIRWRNYHARITQPVGVATQYPLPEMLPKGFALSVTEITDEQIRLYLHSTETETVSLVATVRGQAFYASEVPLTPIGKELVLAAKEFPAGVARFTLFDSRGIERCERLAFVNAHQQLQVEISTDKKQYLPREEVKLKLKVTDDRGLPMPGQFALAVTDDQLLSFADDKSSNLLSWMLLESDIRGEVEEPNFYFDPAEEKASQALDFLMMTAGWRRFSWREITGKQQVLQGYRAEQAVIAGQVLDEKQQPLKGITVQVGYLETQTDREGFFSIDGWNMDQPALVQTNGRQHINYKSWIHSYQNNLRIQLKEHPRTSSQPTQQQGKGIVFGTITDPSGEPLIGATVLIPNTTRGTVADVNGNFSLELQANEQIEVRYLGYASQQHQPRYVPNASTRLDIQMEEDGAALDEVVVTGFGGRSPIKELQGRVAGMTNQVRSRNQERKLKKQQESRRKEERAVPAVANVPAPKEEPPLDDPTDSESEIDEEIMEVFEDDEADLALLELPVNPSADRDFGLAADPTFGGGVGFFGGEVDGEGEIPEGIVEKEPSIDAFIFAEQEPQVVNLEEVKRQIGYPDLARDAAIEGTVVARILVGVKGEYREHRIINSPHPMLSKSVERQLNQLAFAPAVQGGKPTPFWVNIPFQFQLLDGGPTSIGVPAVGPGPTQQTTAYYRAREFAGPDYRGQGRTAQRSDFRSTLYWNPKVELDRRGEAELSFFTSDAITSFQVIAEGIGQDGRLGRGTHRFFSQLPFSMQTKLPTNLLSGDTLELPLTLVNNCSQSVKGQMMYNLPAGLLPLKALPTQLQLPAGEASTLLLPFKVTATQGFSTLEIGFRAGAFSDAVKQELHISPRGFPAQATYSSEDLFGSMTVDLTHAVEGSMDLSFKAFPDVSGEILSGLEGMLREPHGCFEQTSSSTYPNLLVLDYLKETGQGNPEVERRALSLIETGYQRLVGFESRGGGFEWFGKSPAHEGLTAYGLMEFIDMQKVYAGVNQNMVDRTTKWLLKRRDGKGGFLRNGHALHQFGLSDQATMSLYITWALTEAEVSGLEKELAYAYETALENKYPYQLGLAANALQNVGDYTKADILLRQLDAQLGEEGQWIHQASLRSAPGSGGQALSIETASLALMAMLKSPKKDRERIQQTAKYLRSMRRGSGQFGSTNSTVLALRALIAYAQYAKRTGEAGSIELLVDGKPLMQHSYSADHNEPIIIRGLEQGLNKGRHTLEVRFDGVEKALPHTLALTWHDALPQSDQACSVGLKTNLAQASVQQGETVRLTSELTNRTKGGLPMTMAIVGIPAGLSPQPWQLKEMQEEGQVAFYEVWDNEVIFYFRHMAPSEVKTLHLDLKADIPGDYSAPASRAYLYYTDEFKDWAAPLAVQIN
ncbi:MAG: TonB family protein [Bacteroidota bacterium]